ncbi:MAG: DUF4824 family protein [Acidobacteriia bacterium]|nr:DUF4824 family protein [Terriglobia bacterium]
MKRPCLILGIAAILATNAIALIGVSRNRAGGPVQTIELTERELPLQSMGQDNSGVGLRLEWIRQPAQAGEVFSRAELEEIGFDFHIPAGTPGRDLSLLPRVAYVALEYEGKAWEQWLQQAEEEKKRRQSAAQRTPGNPSEERDPRNVSHLVPVGAAKSLTALRSRYPDQSRYLIVQAVLRASLEDVKDPASGSITSHNCVGFVSQILPSDINVPLPQARLISPLKPQMGQEPRYTVTLQYGRNLEPWVASVRLRDNPATK